MILQDRKVPRGTGCTFPSHELATELHQRDALIPRHPQDDDMFHPSHTLKFLYWQRVGKGVRRGGFIAQRREHLAFASLELILTWREGCPEGVHHHIPRNMCVWFAPIRPLCCISCGHLWGWLWVSRELSTTQQRPQEEPRLGMDGCSTLARLTFKSLVLSDSDLGRGCWLQIVKTRTSKIKKGNVASNKPWGGKFASYLGIIVP